jgi:small subunit ribosomal protein S6
MCILNADLDKEATEKTIEKVEDLIKKNKGKVEKVDKWGRRKLAYPIDGHKDGFYTLITFRGDYKTVAELDRVLKLTGEIIRFMIVLIGG